MKKNDRHGSGIIIGSLVWFCGYLADVFRAGAVYKLLSSQEGVAEVFGTSAIASLLHSLRRASRSFWEAVKKFVAKQFEGSRLLKLISDATSGLLGLSGRAVGAFGMTWGIYVVLVAFIKSSVLEGLTSPTADLAIGITAFLASIPLLFADKSIRSLISESSVLSAALTNIFGVPREAFRSKRMSVLGQSGAVILGIVFGLLTYLIPAYHMVCGIAIFIAVALILLYPEGGVVISIGMAPLLGAFGAPSLTLAVAVLMTAVSYFIKVIRGKRIFSVAAADLPIYAFMLAVLLSGIAPGDSNTLENALLCCSLMLIFPLVVNLMRSKRWIGACTVALTASALIMAFIGIAQYLLGSAPSGWIDTDLFSGIASRAVSLFDNPNVFGAYLAAVFPMALSLTLPRYEKKTRILGGVTSLYIVLAAAFTFSRSAWIGLIVGGIAFAVLVSPKGLLCCIPVAAVLLVCTVAFPDTIGARLVNIASLSDSANNYRIAVWNSSWKMLSDCFLCGIGWGEEAFKTAYISYATDGARYAVHSHSLYMQITIQTGLMGLLLMLASVFSVFGKCIGRSARTSDKSGCIDCAKAALAGVVSLMTAGIFDYTWYNFRVFFIFWALLAVACAAVNAEQAERASCLDELCDECSAYVRIDIR